ncbi:amidohydrolase [Rhodococcoides kyotonense]|uniref:Hippurate hydrolase n=1 Tax=Rhodococcoides kyotonense TaxID=398843 RepID=A0A239GEP7_9NOCA|nr:amidohydrolase [Rhodococcus kyotonensis]SNS67620.1 hippurate hydrolase [Rhodococcus kyotonensis]
MTTLAAVRTSPLRALYEDFHKYPEVAFEEHRTTATIAALLRERGLEVTTSETVTGVVGTLRNGDGPVVALRADIDALPIAEQTGVAYASETDAMHACGHDVHITSLIGTIDRLIAERATWSGTVVAIFQPAEEVGSGARAQIASGIFADHPAPDVVLGQHASGAVAPGTVGSRPAVLQAAADTWKVTLRGDGGHAAGPHKTVDLIVLAAAIVLRLQTIVSREVPPNETAVVSVGTIHAGTVSNILPDELTFTVNARSFTEEVRSLIEEAVKRIVNAEARASGLQAEPEFEHIVRFPLNVNDIATYEVVRSALEGEFGAENFTVVEPVTGSEDFGEFGTSFGVPSVYWYFGTGLAEEVADRTPAPNGHSPWYAPNPDVAIETGVRALTAVALRALAGVVQPARLR